MKNKLAANTPEAKGSDVSLKVKRYFFKHVEQEKAWEIMSIAANKQAWLRNHDNNLSKVDKNLFYDEVAKRLLSQIQLMRNISKLLWINLNPPVL